MNLKDLKILIEQKKPINELIIFKYSDSDFIPHQYIKEISDYTQSEIILIESLDNFNLNSTLYVDDNIYIYKCDEFNYDNDKLKNFKNLFIVCKSIDKNTKAIYKDYIIDIPKLEKWQILDYINFNCPTIANNILYLVDILDIFQIDNEISKLSIFSKKKNELSTASFDEKELPKYILNSLLSDGSWNYISKYTIFDLVKALILGNKAEVADILKYDLDIQPAALCSILYNQIKEIINVVVDKNSTADTLNISNGKYWAIKYNYGNINKDRLTKLLAFLTNIDKEVKSGQYGYDNQLLSLIYIQFLT